VRVQERDDRRSAGLSPTTPTVHIDVCRCGSTHDAGTPHESPDWPLASAWAYLTRPVDDVPGELDDEPEEERLPWWDARSSPERRRAILPLVLLGELQAGVLLRALWEVLQTPPGPVA
jgi:hypothetical protein